MQTRISLLTLSILFLTTFQLFSQSLQWRDIPGIPEFGRYEDLYFTDANTGWMIRYNNVHKTTNSGESWTVYFQPGANRSIGFFDGVNGIIGTLDTARPLSRSTNGGANWTIVSGLPDPKPKGICGISIIDENSAVIVGNYYSEARAYATTDKGQTWNIIFNDTSKARSLVDCYFWSRDSGFIVGGYNTTTMLDGYSVIVMTTNGGQTWQKVYQSTRSKEWCWKVCFNKSYSENFGVVSIERFPANGLSYILKTTDRGFSWSETPFMAYDQEGIGFLNESTGWVGGHGVGIGGNDSNYVTTNGGLSWSKAGWGRQMNRIRFINDTLAFACGLIGYKYSRTIVGIPYASTEIPDAYSLYQNYPNPFNPITLIKFNIPKSRNSGSVRTTITVYDALGKLIRTLVNEDVSPGSYQVTFDAGYFPSGVYFYTLDAGDYKETKRMMLLR